MVMSVFILGLLPFLLRFDRSDKRKAVRLLRQMYFMLWLSPFSTPKYVYRIICFFVERKYMYDENWESHLQFLHCPDYALLTYNGIYLLLGLFFCLHAVLKCKSKFVKIMFIICCLSRNTMHGFISFDRRPILYSWASLATLF